MSERLLEAFREEAERTTRIPAFELIEAAGRRRRSRRQHAVVGGAVVACVLGVTGFLSATGGESAGPQPAEDSDRSSLVTTYPGSQMTTLAEGTYEMSPSADLSRPVVRFTLPPGWNSWVGPNRFEGLSDRVTDTRSVNEGVLANDPDWYLSMLVLEIESVAQRGCTTVEVAEGGTASLVRALMNIPRLDVTSGPESTVRFGRPAVHLRLRELGGQDACLRDTFLNSSVDSIGYLERGTTSDAWVVDVDGRAYLVWASWTRDAPRAEVDALLGIIDTIELHDRG